MKSSKLPIQAAPVQRYTTGAPISGENGNGVEASGWLDIAKKIGQVALPIASQLLG